MWVTFPQAQSLREGAAAVIGVNIAMQA